MSNDRRRFSDVEASNAVLHRTIANSDALVLAQMLEPGLDNEVLDVTAFLPWVLVDGPVDGAVPPPNPLEIAEGFREGIRIGGIDPVFDFDADRAFVRSRDDVEVGLRPVHRRRELEGRDRA